MEVYIIVWLEFELAYYDVTVQHVSHMAMGTSSLFFFQIQVLLAIMLGSWECMRVYWLKSFQIKKEKSMGRRKWREEWKKRESTKWYKERRKHRKLDREREKKKKKGERQDKEKRVWQAERKRVRWEERQTDERERERERE